MSPIAEPEVLDLLTRLVEKSLVVYEEDEQGDGRYRLLETIHQYARDRLLETGEAQSLRNRHRDFHVQLAEQAEAELRGPEQPRWLRLLESEHDNFRVALQCCPGEGEGAEAGLRLAAALWWFWKIRGYFSEGRQWLERVVAGSSRVPSATRARALCGAGEISRFQGDLEASKRFAEEAFSVARESGDRWAMAFSLFHLGLATLFEGDVARATEFGQESLAIAQDVGEPWLLMPPYHLLAMVAQKEGDYERAAALFESSLPLVYQVGDRWVIAMTLGLLATVRQQQKEYEQARELHKEQMDLFLQLQDERGVIWSIESIAWAAAEQGHSERAARLLGAAGILRQTIGVAPASSVQLGFVEHAVETARAAMGERGFAAASAEGSRMTLEQAIAYALEEGGA